MSDHLDTQNKKLEILACNDHIAIDFAYKALKSALNRSDDKVLNEFELVARTTRISDTVALVKNTPKSKSFAALISFPNERSPRNISTGEKTIAKATIVAFTKEAEILAKIEAGTEHINSDLSWRVICAQLIRELEATTKEAVAEGVAKGKKAHKVRPPSLTHSSIISRKLKDNKYLANKKITEVQYADFFDAFNEKEIQESRSKTVITNIRKSISLIFEYAQRVRLMTASQIPNIPKISWVQGEEKPVIEESDLSQIMTNFQNFYESSRTNYKTRENRRLLPFYVALTSSCGLRPGEEVVGVKWSHLTKGLLPRNVEVEVNGKMIKVIKDVEVYYADIKGGKLSNRTKDGGLKIVPFSREIIIYQETAKAIEGLYFVRYEEKKSLYEIVKEGKNDLMFIGSGGRSINFADSFNQYMDYLKGKISMRYTQYSLRHEFINSELNRGISKSDIAEQCGTSTKTIESYYQKYKAMHRVARLLSDNDIDYFIEKTKEALK
jgi:integrase